MKLSTESLQDKADSEKSRLLRDVTDRLVQIRKDRNITQKEISEETGMCVTNITRIERDSYDPSIKVLLRYAYALGKTLRIDIIDQETGIIEEGFPKTEVNPFRDQQERRLMAYYRMLNGQQKKMVTNLAKDLTELGSEDK